MGADSALSDSAEQDDLAAAADILRSDASQLLATDSAGYAPIHWAAHNDSIRLGKLLLSYGADLNAVGDVNWTPMELCAQRGGVDFAEWLIANGADASPRRGRLSALLCALLGRKPECEAIARLLLGYVNEVDAGSAIKLYDAARVRATLPGIPRKELEFLTG